MIVLPVISQKKYIINKDTLICYNYNENRKLAILLVEGDKNKELVKQDTILIKQYKDLSVTYQNQIGTYKNQNSIYKTKNDSLTLKINNDILKAQKLERINTMEKTILGTTTVVGIIGWVLFILKP